MLLNFIRVEDEKVVDLKQSPHVVPALHIYHHLLRCRGTPEVTLGTFSYLSAIPS